MNEYERVLEGFGLRFATVPELKVSLDYEPASAEESPLLYSVLDGFTSEVRGTVEMTTWRTLHRLCVRWVDPEEAERTLRLLVVALKRCVAQDPRLAGHLVSQYGRGVAHITDGDAGWIKIAGTMYRSVDLISEALVYTGYPAQ